MNMDYHHCQHIATLCLHDLHQLLLQETNVLNNKILRSTI